MRLWDSQKALAVLQRRSSTRKETAMVLQFIITLGRLKLGLENGCLFVETEWVDAWIGRYAGYSFHRG